MERDRSRAKDNGRTRRMRHRLRTILSLITGVTVLWPYSFSVGAAGATFTLINRTPYFLHAVINNEASAYIAPGAVVNYDAGGMANIAVKVRYSPGQSAKGSTFRSFEIIYHTTGSSSGNTSSTCNQQSNSCDSSVESSVTVTPEPVTWSVTEADLAQ